MAERTSFWLQQGWQRFDLVGTTWSRTNEQADDWAVGGSVGRTEGRATGQMVIQLVWQESVEARMGDGLVGRSVGWAGEDIPAGRWLGASVGANHIG